MNSQSAGTTHIPVMEREVVEYLKASEGGDFLDCTLGGAGHACAILSAHPRSRLVASDRDACAIERARIRLCNFSDRVALHQVRFSDLEKICESNSFDGILADLGVSTDQLKENRGFSFSDNVPLDMRMDRRQALSAENVVNRYGQAEFFRVLKKGGVGRDARAVCDAVMQKRPILTARGLAEVVNAAAYGKSVKRKISPATIVFQAIRIEVNQELEEIAALLAQIPNLVRSGGRFVAITFHSLEDKLIAGAMRGWQGREWRPALWPHSAAGNGPCCDRGAHKLGKMLTPKGIRASAAEAVNNPSARSARLRVFEFCGEG